MKQDALAWVDRFSRHLETERRVSPHTASSYRLDLEALITFCDKSGLPDWQALKAPEIRTFGARERGRGLSGSSIQRRLSTVRTFLNFLIREGVIAYNWARDVRAPRARRKLPEILTIEEMTQLIERPTSWPEYDPAAVRDRAIMELFYSSGLRVAELVSLNIEDLDRIDRTVRLVGKGSRERIVPVGRMAITAIANYLRQRRAHPREVALFLGRNGRRLTTRAVQKRVAYWADKARIAKRMYPHIFRHSAATHLLESCRDIRAVQEFLGHVDISTTAIYTHLDARQLTKVYMSAHPRAKIIEPIRGPRVSEASVLSATDTEIDLAEDTESTIERPQASS